MDYWQLRNLVKDIVPRNRRLLQPEAAGKALVREKGRKRNYHQFDLLSGCMEKRERLLNTEGLRSFVEVSCRATECPMPLNLDVWDGFRCVAEGQLVQTPDGYKPVEDLVKGDVVRSYDEASGELSESAVLATYNSVRSDMIRLITDGGEIRVTSDHPVFTKRGWIQARELTKLDEILGLS